MGQNGNQTKMAADDLSLGQECQPQQEVNLDSFLYQPTVITDNLVIIHLYTDYV